LNIGYLLPMHDMRTVQALGLGLLIAGVLMTVLGVLGGDIVMGLALFFIPYLQSSTWLGASAIALIFAGIAVLMLDRVRSLGSRAAPMEEGASKSIDGQPKGEFGGVVLVGPVPIIFGTGNRAALWALIAMAVVVMAMMLILLFLFY